MNLFSHRAMQSESVAVRRTMIVARWRECRHLASMAELRVMRNIVFKVRSAGRALALCCALMIDLAALSVPTFAQNHPLDALTREEIVAATKIVTGDPQMRDLKFQLITLLEPRKSEVLSWKLGSSMMRRASVSGQRGAEVLEIEVDLTAKSIASVKTVEGVELPITIEDSSKAIEAVRQDPRMLEAFGRRGFVGSKLVDCAPFTIGYYGIKAHEGRRLLRVGCFDISRSTNNIFGWPIEKLYALVDLRTMTVIDVVDTGIVEVSPAEMNFTEAATIPLRKAEKPTLIAQPRGKNFVLKGSEVSWGNWRFHLRFENRQGTVISLVRWSDRGRERHVMYQGYMSEMFVPYMDPDTGWYSRTYFDMGEYGIGHLASPLKAGIDCPHQATFLDAVLADEKGDPDERLKVVCIFERNTGDPAWRHYEVNKESYEGRPGVELVVRMASQVGNYDYLIDWVFNHAGEIEARVGSTGIVGLKGVVSQTMRDATAHDDTATGTLVAPGLTAVQHDHFFNFRLDLDVDGPENTFLTDVYNKMTLPTSSARRSIYTVAQQMLEREGIAVAVSHQDHGTAPTDVKLRVINETKTNNVGNFVGYEIVHSNHAHFIADQDDWPAKRAAFLQGDVWVTPFDPSEKYAAGQYVFASKGDQGLPRWTQAARPVRGTDLVVWVNMGMHHLTRAEDVPVMPLVWHSFKLRPFNFFDRNPAVDLRSKFAR